MPYIESAFHKAPPSKKAAVARKPRSKKTAPELEPKLKPPTRKFMTEAGAAYLKSLEGNSTITDYDQFIVSAPKTKKSPNTKTEASIAKKLRLNPEQTVNPDLEHRSVEKKSVQADLYNVGYLFLPCEDEKKIRGDTLSYLKHEYRAFAVSEVRADKTGYFMVFEKTVKGDRDLTKCFDI
ncbi:hypothetical protein BKA65DRAFT_96629 [Rhexocercosporidium sp. MPI-PUGE-AT-0058]|nr:hypothetical protein BKA65DRAFT_96629 [Rhexocercosporidium sp. MPI-PUGE-AT-0058]